ncbi:MAG: hypothetical protein NC221_06725 [Duncaniella sp.]|nr:hypothetical protein [Muribaculum sp.]MCM1255794.1 hypothetical protein [Duncaniella sp.]
MKKGQPIVIILIAIAIIFVISLLPLSKWTDGKIKDFSLFSDILKEAGFIEGTPSAEEEEIDPALLAAIAHADSMARDSIAALPVDTIITPVKVARNGELVMIEDYTTESVGLYHLKKAIHSGGLARITVVGDSYIEGDIFTQDLRELLQEAYGGEGVGFVNMHSDFPGFRRSIRQGGDGWKTLLANKKGKEEYLFISEQYAMPSGNALATYKGSTSYPHAESWSNSRFIFISPENSTINVKTSEGEWEERNIEGSPNVQCLEVNAPTSEFDIKTSDQSLICFGVWLDGNSGISLDCMSSRGFSGITLTKINQPLCREISTIINYDLIILEFGINAMSSAQKNYSVYSSKMVDVINHVRNCFPRADILLMGVGDRGEKRGSQVKSMSTAQAMVTAQRDAARRAHCLFWDTREAMGGEDAVVAWSNAGLINKDYVHMSHKGGARLAKELFNAIQHQLQ